ncbi:MAG: hypothetical protein E7652_06700 [Ruminococcaceae bacterium]|nr:hypothetical protein [Oscillospiraceae bacterium]
MSERVWTEGQRNAIEAKGSDLLVSASAGSGKTAVLIERIIRHITDTENRTDISEMLIVTFTEAAAKQLKSKLAVALKDAINKAKDGKKHLRRQLAMLPRASISTIDGFCYDLVKSNFAALGLSANVRIADAQENALIMKEVMERCIEDFYDRGEELGIKDFASLCYAYSELSDSVVGDIFLDIYETLYTRAEGIEILRTNADELEATVYSDPFDNKWGEVIKRRCGMYLSECKRRYTQVKDILAFDGEISKGYGKSLYADLDKLDALYSAFDKGYFELRDEIQDYKPIVSIGKYTGDNEEDKNICSEARSFYKDTVSALQEYVSNTREATSVFTSESARINRELYAFMSYFHEKAMAEKRRRGVVSFSDCEALTLKLLCEDGKPTKIAEGYREKYSEVYIDEYQDVNSIQDTIFRMVSRPASRFLVGDIKQSIYGFRGADPSLFGNYRDSFIDYTTNEDSEGKRIFLANNFRSSRNIIDFANAISQGTFEDAESKVGYYEGDRLVCSKVKEERDDNKPVTVAIVAQNEEKNAEALYVCDEIEKLLARGVKPGEISILMRTMTSAVKFAAEMERRGIPYYASSKKSFFDNPEIALSLCWLNTIDNTRRDVYVCGILKSPIYNFSLDELTLIRNEYPRDTLYNSVKAYTANNDFEKGRAFISDIEELRAYSRGKSASELLWLLMYDRKLMNAVTKGKRSEAARLSKNNLLLFYDYAKNFENGEFKGLNNFLSYIDELIAAKHTMPNAAAFAGSGDTVKIMTIHKSKGLEFPYCFVCNTHGLADKRDLRKRILYHDKLGVASNIPDKSGLGYYNSYIMDALRLAIEEDIIESEYLVLYVALTRGVNRMWITCNTAKPDDFADKYIDEYMTKLYTLLKPRYISWILPSLKYAPADCYNLEYIYDVLSDRYAEHETEEEEKSEIDRDRLIEGMKFEYPYDKLGMIPAKVAVSKLYPDILDDDISLDMTAILKPKVPFFSKKEKRNRGAEVGNATHAFMQFCDFENIDNNGIENELERLKDRAFLSEEAASLVDIAALEAFFASELYSMMKGADKLYREKRFNVNLDASEFTSLHIDALEGEKILVQGVIDCFIYDKNGDITLVDYKTDRIPHNMTKEEGRALLRERHSTQLSYYKKALESLTGDNVTRTLIYSFGLNEAIEL